MTAGNHDSPSRLEAPRELWEAFNVTVVGNIDFYKESDENELTFDASKVEIPVKRNDEIVGWILAIPFLNAGNYPSLKENDTYSNRVFSFYNDLKNNLKLNSQFTENHAVIAMGHFMMSGVNSNSYSKMIGGLESVAKEDILSLKEIDYWALGHVHHPQFVGENMRYSGSPFALTFNEIYPHSVTVVDIENHNVDIKILEIEPLVPVVDFPSKPNSYDDALPVDDVLGNIDEVLDNECYVRLHVKSEMALSDVVNAKIMDVFEERKAKYCGIQVYLPETKADNSENTIRTIDEFKAISPFELGCSVFKKKNNMEMPDEMKTMFKNVCDEMMKIDI